MNTYNKINVSRIVALALFGLFLTVSNVVKAQEFVPGTGTSNNSEEATPALIGSNTDENPTPTNSGTNGPEAPTIIPNAQGTGANEGGAIIPNQGGANNDEISGTDTPIIPVEPANPSSGSGPVAQTFGGGSGGFSGGSGASTILPLLGSTTKCSYINDYLKIDGTNSSVEVSKLQSFLKNIEKINVDINGNFDQKTFDAVKAFQTKYANDVLIPWGGNTSTGQVYYTTKKKINEIYCKSTFSLTPEQLAEIEAYRNGSVQATANISTLGSTTTNSLTPDVGSNTNESQTAAAAGTSFASKIWGFIKWLFGY